MLVIPMLFGFAAGGWRSVASWLVPLATVLVFLAHHAIVPWAQRARERKASPQGYAVRRVVWGAGYLAAATLVFAYAVRAANPGARASFVAVASVAALLAAVYALAATWGHARSIVFEVLGMTGVSLTAPMMAAAAGSAIDRSLFATSALALAYFLSSLSYVRAYEGLRTNRAIAIRGCVLVHVALATALATGAAFGALPPWWWIAFAPVAARTV